MKVSSISFPSCFYCNETCFSEEGVFYPNNSSNYITDIRIKFCTPECVCAYNKYILGQKGILHCVLEKYYERHIVCAPERKFLHSFSLRGGMQRAEWLSKCREGLTPTEIEVSPKTSGEKNLRIVKK